MEKRTARPPWEHIALAFLTIGFLTWSARFIQSTAWLARDGQWRFSLFDDAMIAMRYAWNLAHGAGLAWNVGQPPVEGYTSLLMTLLMALPALVLDRSTAVLAVQVFGVGTVLGCAWLSWRIAGHIAAEEPHPCQPLVRLLSFFAVLTCYPLVYWSLMGMEAGLLALLLLFSTLAALEYLGRPSRARLLRVGAGLGAAFLVRPEALLYAALLLAWIGLEDGLARRLRDSWPALLGALGLLALPAAGQTLFRLLYYGELVPNTFALKLTGLPLLVRLSTGWSFVRLFLAAYAIVLIVVGLDQFRLFRRARLLLVLMVLVNILYQVGVGGDAWFYWRMLVPTLPLALILFSNAAAAIGGFYGQALNQRFPRRRPAAIAAIAAVLLALVVTGWSNRAFWPEMAQQESPYLAPENWVHMDIGLALAEVTTPQATVGVIWAGTIPYYSGRPAVDFLGKSDRYIAHLPADFSSAVSRAGFVSVPGHNKYDLSYSLQRLLPTYTQAVRWGRQDLSAWAGTRYVVARYRGVTLTLLRDSPDVLWEKLDRPD